MHFLSLCCLQRKKDLKGLWFFPAKTGRVCLCNQVCNLLQPTWYWESAHIPTGMIFRGEICWRMEMWWVFRTKTECVRLKEFQLVLDLDVFQTVANSCQRNMISLHILGLHWTHHTDLQTSPDIALIHTFTKRHTCTHGNHSAWGHSDSGGVL